MKPVFSLMATSALLSSCVTSPLPMDRSVASGELRAPDGRALGTVRVARQGNSLNLTLQASGLSAGPHGAHIHAVGKCDDAAFAMAGGHLNPAQRQHGTHNPAGSHLGDLPNLVVASDGTGRMEAILSDAADETLAALFDGDGASVVVHAGEDDYRTDPSGNSGARIACGVLRLVP